MRIDERLLAGAPVPEEPELIAWVSAVRSLADAPAPLPTPALSRVLSEGLPGDPPASLQRHRRTRRSTLAKIALGAAVAAAAATGAAALEIPESVREPARSFFTGVADLFTPWESGPQPQPQPHPQPGSGPSEPVGGQPADESTTRPDPANRPDDPGKRPEPPANPPTPQAPGNPEVNPGPPDAPGRPAEPGPPGDTGRDPASQRTGAKPVPLPAPPAIAQVTPAPIGHYEEAT